MATKHQQELNRINSIFELRRTQAIGEDSSRTQQILTVCLPGRATYHDAERIEQLIQASRIGGEPLDWNTLVVWCTIVAVAAIFTTPIIISQLRLPGLHYEQMQDIAEDMAKRVLIQWHCPDFVGRLNSGFEACLKGMASG